MKIYSEYFRQAVLPGGLAWRSCLAVFVLFSTPYGGVSGGFSELGFRGCPVWPDRTSSRYRVGLKRSANYGPFYGPWLEDL